MFCGAIENNMQKSMKKWNQTPIFTQFYNYSSNSCKQQL